MELLGLGFNLKQTRFYQDAWQEGHTEGKAFREAHGIAKILIRILTDKFGTLPSEVIDRLMASKREVLLGYFEKSAAVTDLNALFEEAP